MYCLVRRSLSPSRAAESVIDFHAQRTPPRRRNARMSGRQDAAGPSTAAATRAAAAVLSNTGGGLGLGEVERAGLEVREQSSLAAAL